MIASGGLDHAERTNYPDWGAWRDR